MASKNERTVDSIEAKLIHLQSIIDEPVHTKYLWDNTIQEYAVKSVHILRFLDKNEVLEKGSEECKNVYKNLHRMSEMCLTREIYIALVGTNKAGKSTLINALLGCGLDFTEITPVTAPLLKFKCANEIFMEISFFSDTEWEELWQDALSSSQQINNAFIEDYNLHRADAEKHKWLGHEDLHITCVNETFLNQEIEKWVSWSSKAHYFIKEIVIGLKDFSLPSGFVLVDTPGLDDAVEFRSNITRQYIKRADAVLLCIKSDALTGGELRTCFQVFTNARNNVEKIFVVATQHDTLNRPLKDWDAQQAEWTKYLKGQNCFRSTELAQRNLIPVSAYLYILMEKYRKKLIDEEDDRFFEDFLPILLKLQVKRNEIDTRFDEIMDFTNIKSLKMKLARDIIPKHEKILVQEATSAYEACIDAIRKLRV